MEYIVEAYANMIKGWLGAVHFGFSVIALVTGAIVLLRKKGTTAHKKVGYVYTVSMIALNLSAIPITNFFGGIGPFHIFILFSLPTVLLAIYYPTFGRNDPEWLAKHLSFMSWSYMGLFAAFISEIVTRVPLTWLFPSGQALAITVFLVVLITMVTTEILLRRYRAKHNLDKKRAEKVSVA